MATSVDRAGPVELGFVSDEDVNPNLLHSAFFPSKVGGRPSWLHLSSLPPPAALQCQVCKKPSVFLMQIYAPIEGRPSCFHRTVFLFICRDATCSASNDSSNIRAYRSQLPRRNPFYSFDPPDYNAKKVDLTSFKSASDFQTLCVVCGCPGPKCCSGCRNRNFCSKEHQKIDWTLGGHKGSCNRTPTEPAMDHNALFLFPQHQIDTEAEEDGEDGKKGREVDPEEELNKAKGYSTDFSETELEAMATQESTAFKSFTAFKKRVARAPDQILRYCRGGEPLWIADSPTPTVPPCHLCGSPRTFELQIMPQLLTHLNVDDVNKSIDWGVISVFTCSISCDIPDPTDPTQSAYVQEFVVKQDVSN